MSSLSSRVINKPAVAPSYNQPDASVQKTRRLDAPSAPLDFSTPPYSSHRQLPPDSARAIAMRPIKPPQPKADLLENAVREVEEALRSLRAAKREQEYREQLLCRRFEELTDEFPDDYNNNIDEMTEAVKRVAFSKYPTRHERRDAIESVEFRILNWQDAILAVENATLVCAKAMKTLTHLSQTHRELADQQQTLELKMQRVLHQESKYALKDKNAVKKAEEAFRSLRHEMREREKCELLILHEFEQITNDFAEDYEDIEAMTQAVNAAHQLDPYSNLHNYEQAIVSRKIAIEACAKATEVYLEAMSTLTKLSKTNPDLADQQQTLELQMQKLLSQDSKFTLKDRVVVRSSSAQDNKDLKSSSSSSSSSSPASFLSRRASTLPNDSDSDEDVNGPSVILDSSTPPSGPPLDPIKIAVKKAEEALRSLRHEMRERERFELIMLREFEQITNDFPDDYEDIEAMTQAVKAAQHLDPYPNLHFYRYGNYEDAIVSRKFAIEAYAKATEDYLEAMNTLTKLSKTNPDLAKLRKTLASKKEKILSQNPKYTLNDRGAARPSQGTRSAQADSNSSSSSPPIPSDDDSDGGETSKKVVNRQPPAFTSSSLRRSSSSSSNSSSSSSSSSSSRSPSTLPRSDSDSDEDLVQMSRNFVARASVSRPAREESKWDREE